MEKTTLNEAIEKFKIPENKDKLFVVNFVCKNCVKSQEFDPVLKDIIRMYSDKNNLIFLEIDAEKSGVYKDPFAEYVVLETPTFKFVKNNKILKSISGYWPKEIFINLIEEFL